MDFGRTQITGLLSNVVHEKAKFMGLLHKLDLLLKISTGHKLIVTGLDKLLLTAFPGDVYENISYRHPIVSILREYLAKTAECPNGGVYFISMVRSLVKEVSFLLDNGVRPKAISDVFRDISDVRLEDVSGPPPGEAGGDGPVLDGGTLELIRDVVKDGHLSGLLVECIQATGGFDTEKIRICKVPAGTTGDSYRVEGMVLNRRPEGRVTRLAETSVGIFNCPLDINRTELKGTVLFKNHGELLRFSEDEAHGIKALVDALNVNALVVCGKVDSLFLEFANRRSILVLKAFSKFDLKRICDTVGGSIYNQLGPVRHKGTARSISVLTDGGHDFTKIVGGTRVNTIVLKNSVREVLDEQERAITRLLNGLKNSGGGALCSPALHSAVADFVGQEGAIRGAVAKVLRSKAPEKMALPDAVRCLRYVFEFLGVLLEVDDYLVARRDALDVKPPQHDGHWDEDH